MQKIFVSTVFKSGTKLLEHIVQSLTGRQIAAPGPIVTPDYASADMIHFPAGKFFIWHNVPSPQVKGFVRQHKAKAVFLVRNAFDLAVAQYFHFAKDVDWEVGHSTGTYGYFSAMSRDQGLAAVLCGVQSTKFSWHGFGFYLHQMQEMLRFSKEYPCLVISYDALVRDKRAQIKRLADYLDANATPEVLDAIEESSSFSTMKNARINQFGSGEHFRRGQPGDHINVLGEHHYAMICHLMDAFAPDLVPLALELGMPEVVLGVPSFLPPPTTGQAPGVLNFRKDLSADSKMAAYQRVSEYIAAGDYPTAMLYFANRLVETENRDAVLNSKLDARSTAAAALYYLALAGSVAGETERVRPLVETLGVTFADGFAPVCYDEFLNGAARLIPLVAARRAQGKPGVLVFGMPASASEQFCTTLADFLEVPLVRTAFGVFPHSVFIPSWLNAVAGGCVSQSDLAAVRDVIKGVRSGNIVNLFLQYRDPRDAAWLYATRDNAPPSPTAFIEAVGLMASWLDSWVKFLPNPGTVRVHLVDTGKMISDPPALFRHVLTITGARFSQEALTTFLSESRTASALAAAEGQDADAWRQRMPAEVIAQATSVLSPRVITFLRQHLAGFRL